MEYPKLSISIITYNRPDEFRQVFESIQANVIYPKDKLIFIFADDGSDTDYLLTGKNISHLQHNRVGMPRQWNAAIRAAEDRADFTLCCQDDWLFTEPIDLRLGVLFLTYNPAYGMLRYHKVTGNTGLLCNVQEWDTRGVIGYSDGPHEYAPHLLNFFELFPTWGDSNTYSPYSGGVHLRHKRFTQFYGGYREGAGFSDAELDFQTRVNTAIRTNLDSASRVAMFPHYVKSRFADLTIGKSYRGTEVEAETMKE